MNDHEKFWVSPENVVLASRPEPAVELLVTKRELADLLYDFTLDDYTDEEMATKIIHASSRPTTETD